MCPGMFSSRVRDIMRPHQTTFWQQWTQRFHGGTGDTALATAAQLLLFLDAVAQWHSMCQAKGKNSNEQLQGNIKMRLEMVSQKLHFDLVQSWSSAAKSGVISDTSLHDKGVKTLSSTPHLQWRRINHHLTKSLLAVGTKKMTCSPFH